MVVGLADCLPQNYEDIEMSKDQPKGEKVTAIVTLKGHTGQEFCQGFTFFFRGVGGLNTRLGLKTSGKQQISLFSI